MTDNSELIASLKRKWKPIPGSSAEPPAEWATSFEQGAAMMAEAKDAEITRLSAIEERAKSLFAKCGPYTHINSGALPWILKGETQ
jgi:hypothetical protein